MSDKDSRKREKQIEREGEGQTAIVRQLKQVVDRYKIREAEAYRQ